jgi:hypothetical protein
LDKETFAMILFAVVLAQLCLPCHGFFAGPGPVLRHEKRIAVMEEKYCKQWVSALSSNSVLLEPSPDAQELKQELISKVELLRKLKERDGDFSVDFGVKGGELNETSRAPNSVDFYQISKDVGDAAQNVMTVADKLADINLCDEPTKYIGDKVNGTLAPLNGPWKLLFTTAADASFSSNSTRGSAKVQNVVSGDRGIITNIVQFNNNSSKVQELNVVIKATATSKSRVELNFLYAKVILSKFLWIKRFPIYIPVPALFITRCVKIIQRVLKFLRIRKKDVTKTPKGYFDVVYLDKDLRIHKTGENNLFIQAKPTWQAAAHLIN